MKKELENLYEDRTKWCGKEHALLQGLLMVAKSIVYLADTLARDQGEGEKK